MKSRPPYLWLGGVMSLYAAVFLAYSQTLAFTLDEGYHLLAAQLIGAGKTPYLDFCFPQTPLNAYWNAFWLKFLGNTWRVPHLLAALATIGAVWLMADYVLRRFPAEQWRVPAAIAVVLAIGLNGAVFPYGPLQAYGMCLLGLVSAFCLAVRAVERSRKRYAAGAGVAAGIAAGSSLLSAAAAPVLLLWLLYYQPGRRRKNFVAFTVGVALPFLPVFWLFVSGPRQTWFNIFRYHAFYRRLYWPETTQHDLEVLGSWLGDAPALILGLLALGGLLFVRRSAWPASVKAEFYLCAWLAAALAAEVARAHPTFSRYFLLTVPFLAILAGAGLFALTSALQVQRSRWPLTLLAILMVFGLAKTLYERSHDVDTWAPYQRLATKIDQVTPPGAPVLAVEVLYFLTHRTPPSGYELWYTHKLTLPPAEMALFHLFDDAEVKRQVKAGNFATIYSCDSDEIDAWGLTTLYKQSAEMESCTLFWDRK
ncbi:MAG: hypothetical protein ABI806_24470 [Candidatus Solibacter sp.]